MPVSRPVSGTGCVGTSAHEHDAYQPSAGMTRTALANWYTRISSVQI
jgi:hypothetical protein